MKKFTLLFATLLAATFSQAQITLEHTFTSWVDISRELIIAADGEIPFGEYLSTTQNGVVTLYNANDYSVVASWNIIGREAQFVSKNLFTTDNLFAYLVRVSDDEASDANQSLHFYIYNENNQLIADLGTSAYQEGITGILKIGSSYKLILNKVLKDYSYQIEIYSLPGNGTATSVSEVPAKHFAAPYPNPTHGIINLPYELSTTTGQMQIFDVNGRLMETRLISKQNDILELNTTNYPAGLYFYEVEGTSQSFLVE